MKTHKDLDIWKKGIEFVEEIYKATANFPKDELLWFNITNEKGSDILSKQYF